MNALKPGATIGILGGGQLGRMLALAAARMGLRCHIFEPGANCPARQVSAETTTASYDDISALRAFAQSVDVVTFEFENIPNAALATIEDLVPIRPGVNALMVSQDRSVEKTFLRDLGLGTAPFLDVDSAESLGIAVAKIGPDGILKTRRFGYDGKGQVRIAAGDDLEAAWASMHDAPSILEGLVPFSREISVIAARGLDGAVACFDPGENLHEGGILRRTTVPADVPSRLKMDAIVLAGQILNALDYVGVMGIELFVTPQGLLVNEIAPRVHNSGHWTQNGCLIDQFEQHMRAVAGWPLGSGGRHSDCVMENLIGDDLVIPAAGDDCAVHYYGKADARPGRKMGHINRISSKS